MFNRDADATDVASAAANYRSACEAWTEEALSESPEGRAALAGLAETRERGARRFIYAEDQHDLMWFLDTNYQLDDEEALSRLRADAEAYAASIGVPPEVADETISREEKHHQRAITNARETVA